MFVIGLVKTGAASLKIFRREYSIQTWFAISFITFSSLISGMLNLSDDSCLDIAKRKITVICSGVLGIW